MTCGAVARPARRDVGQIDVPPPHEDPTGAERRIELRAGERAADRGCERCAVDSRRPVRAGGQVSPDPGVDGLTGDVELSLRGHEDTAPRDVTEPRDLGEVGGAGVEGEAQDGGFALRRELEGELRRSPRLVDDDEAFRMELSARRLADVPRSVDPRLLDGGPQGHRGVGPRTVRLDVGARRLLRGGRWPQRTDVLGPGHRHVDDGVHGVSGERGADRLRDASDRPRPGHARVELRRWIGGLLHVPVEHADRVRPVHDTARGHDDVGEVALEVRGIEGERSPEAIDVDVERRCPRHRAVDPPVTELDAGDDQTETAGAGVRGRGRLGGGEGLGEPELARGVRVEAHVDRVDGDAGDVQGQRVLPAEQRGARRSDRGDAGPGAADREDALALGIVQGRVDAGHPGEPHPAEPLDGEPPAERRRTGRR